MPAHSSSGLTSIRTDGCASLKFIAGIRLCPPERNLASSPYSAFSERARSRDEAAMYLKGAGYIDTRSETACAKASRSSFRSISRLPLPVKICLPLKLQNCFEIMQKPAHYSVGLCKHWA